MPQWRAQVVRDCVADGVQFAVGFLNLREATSKLVIVARDGLRVAGFRGQENYHVARDTRPDIEPLFGAASEDSGTERFAGFHDFTRDLRQREARGRIVGQRFSNQRFRRASQELYCGCIGEKNPARAVQDEARIIDLLEDGGEVHASVRNIRRNAGARQRA